MEKGIQNSGKKLLLGSRSYGNGNDDALLDNLQVSAPVAEPATMRPLDSGLIGNLD